jgi:hypothetical protein
MPSLIQCTSCKRKLRVQEHLLGKYVKCPSCQTKFQAQPIEEPTPKPAAASPPAAPGSAEEMQQTPVVPPILPPANPEMMTPVVQILELTEPASSPPQPAAPPRSSERLAAVSAPAPPAPAAPPPAPRPPPPFPTPRLRVFAVLGAILLLTAVVGLGVSWWVAAAVNRAVEARPTK